MINLNREEDNEDEEESLSEALLAVASAEEYAAKIIKLQQACLTPLKEDLADWLNKIMNISIITTDNFMDKLDNGVIICRLAKIISIWCEQQLAQQQQQQQPPIPQATTTTHVQNIFQQPSNSSPITSVTQQSHNLLPQLSSTHNQRYLNHNNVQNNHLSQIHNSNHNLMISSQLKLNCSQNIANSTINSSTSSYNSNYSPKFSLSNSNVSINNY